MVDLNFGFDFDRQPMPNFSVTSMRQNFGKSSGEKFLNGKKEFTEKDGQPDQSDYNRPPVLRACASSIQLRIRFDLTKSATRSIIATIRQCRQKCPVFAQNAGN
jgi:hypothetical protein